MSDLIDELINEERAAERDEVRTKTALNMLKIGRLKTEEVAECSGLTLSEVRNLNAGLCEGYMEGEQRICTLITKLLELEQEDDVFKAAQDSEFRNQLLRRYHL